jgi:hydroxyacylglutathione hydrolase
MSLIFERIVTDGIAAVSYLIGDDEEGMAAVIDPRTDVEIYIELARKTGVSITHILETHIHADLVSGSRELANRTGTAKIYASSEAGAEYGFDHEPVKDGDQFKFGSLILTARHTPGHTPEHVSYLAAEDEHPEHPWGVFTGDSLFVSSAGRPDLLGRDADKLASQLYDTIWGFYAGLADGVIIYPSHGSGSPCGADIGERLDSTIGYEKQFNPYYERKERQAFVDYALSTPPPEPTYYKRMKKLNAAGPEVLGHLPNIPALAPQTFWNMVEKKSAQLVDARTMLAFGGGHIEDALNIAASPILSIWAGWLLDPEKPILLVLENDGDVEKIAQLFVRTGYTKFAGYLVGGMKAWKNNWSMCGDPGNGRMAVSPARSTSSCLICKSVRMNWTGTSRFLFIARPDTAPASPPACCNEKALRTFGISRVVFTPGKQRNSRWKSDFLRELKEACFH